MIQKYYIFVLTFLCLFCGQMSYGQNLDEGFENEWLVQAFLEAGGTINYYGTNEDYANAKNSDDDISNDVIDKNGDGIFSAAEIASSIFDFEIIDVTTLAGETAYVLSNGDLFLLSSMLNEVVIISGVPSGTVPKDPDPSDPIPDPDPTLDPDPIPCPSGDPCECYGIECEDPTPEPGCLITSCPLGYVLVDCECICPKKTKALIANLVYDSHNGIPNDYSKLPSNVTIINPVNIPGVTFTNTDIGFNSTLYRVDNGNGNVEYVYATEGSTLELQDWLNNGQQATGNIADQYTLSVDNAIKLQQWASSQGTPNISFTGHSLGGGLANANALATGYPATVFNPAGLHDNTISRLGLNLTYANNVNYYVNTGEIVDMANTLFSTPARGTRHEIGNNAVVAAAVWNASTLGGVVYSGYLHTMGSVLANLDCN